MVRHYKMKGQKRKKKNEKYDREEEEEQPEIEQQLDEQETSPQSKKAKTEVSDTDKEEKAEQVVDEVPGLPIVPVDMGRNKPGVIFILEKASLEIAKVGKKYELLSSDEHAHYLMKNKRNPADYRPDIAFESIKTILDSCVNKNGRLKALYVRTEQNLLIKIEPHARLPRTYRRFAGLMVQLLQKLHITSARNGEKLLRVVKNPVTQYLPVNSHKIGFSHSSEKLVNIYDYVRTINDDMDLVFVVGAMAHGKINNDFVEDFISISEFPMSALYCIARITTAIELKWKIL